MNIIEEYINFQANSVSPFHVIDFVKKSLTKSNFISLSLTQDKWNLEKNKSYIVCHPNAKAAICFKLGEFSPQETGFLIVGTHIDSPVFRLKSQPLHKTKDNLCLLPQIHGGMILRSWLDRPLELAGQVHSLVKKDKNTKINKNFYFPKIETKLVRSKRSVAVIPDIAIHLDPNKNKEGSINPEEFLKLMFCSNNKDNFSLADFFKKAFKINKKIDGFEIYCSPTWPHTVVGTDNSFIVGPRHDDLAMVFSALRALKSSQNRKRKKTSILCLLDSEETGSQTCAGAGSTFVKDVLTRITEEYPNTKNSYSSTTKAFGKSLLLSADMAHAVHPGKPSKHDSQHRPQINKGIVIKDNANDRYATSGYSSTIVKGYCEAAKIPYQDFVSRQDMGCGSTIGPILSASLNCIAADIGVAMWGMHSSAETMGTKDLSYACDFFETAFLYE